MAASTNRYSTETLTAGDDDVVITVDFATFSSGPTLGSLLAADNCGHAVLRVDAVSDLASSPHYHPLRSLARAYAETLVSQGTKVGLIASHCSCAAFATHLAAAIADCGGRPPIVALIAPTWPTLADVEWEFANIRHSFEAVSAPEPAVSSIEDPVSVLAELDTILRADVAEMCEREQKDEVEREIILTELLGRYRAWLGFLLASVVAGPVMVPGALYIITGSECSAPVPAILAGAQIATLGAETADLLSISNLAAQIHALTHFP